MPLFTTQMYNKAYSFIPSVPWLMIVAGHQLGVDCGGARRAPSRPDTFRVLQVWGSYKCVTTCGFTYSTDSRRRGVQ